MRLATFNLLNGRSVDDGLVDLGRLRAAVRTIDADILAIQEVDRDQDRSGGHDQTAEVADVLGAEHWRFEPALLGTPGGTWRAAVDGDGTRAGVPCYGIGLVSRFPVTEWHVLRLGLLKVKAPVYAPPRGVMLIDDEPRIGLAAVVETPHGPITVVSSHLSFLPGWSAVQLRRLLVGFAGLPYPRILVGDLNMPQRLARRLTGMQLLAPNLKTFPSPDPRLQLDHALGTPGLPRVVAAAAPRLPVSDHRPLVLDFER